MVKRVVLAIIAVFVAWTVLDFIIHVVILRSTYKATAQLWRPEGEMKMELMYVIGIVVAAAFVSIYAYLVRPHSVETGLKYGLLFGLVTGLSMGYGSYSVMPIPHHMALVWCLGGLVELVVGGLLVGVIVKEKTSEA